MTARAPSTGELFRTKLDRMQFGEVVRRLAGECGIIQSVSECGIIPAQVWAQRKTSIPSEGRRQAYPPLTTLGPLQNPKVCSSTCHW